MKDEAFSQVEIGEVLRTLTLLFTKAVECSQDHHKELLIIIAKLIHYLDEVKTNINESIIEIKIHIIWSFSHIYNSSILNQKNAFLPPMLVRLKLIDSLIG